jgi:PEP-CTERM motif
MKIANVVLVIGTLVASPLGHAQGFMNLDFENAVIVPDSSHPNEVFANSAIPGWTAYVGSTPQTSIVYNTVSLGATSIAILGATGVPSSLSGAYSIDLYGGQTATSASISQTGLVPVGTQSILFKAHYSGPPGGTLLVSLGGQGIAFSPISSTANYTIYGGDVSAFAGQAEQLVFAAPQGANNYWNLDDIQFSSQAVPEPSTLALSVLGALALVSRFVRRKA